ncbi:MAG: TonB-dependent receptor [Burkholderiaceae bacterium]
MPSSSIFPTKKLHRVALAVAVACGPASLVYAQQTPATEAGKLESVTVTAERRAENIKDVPSAVFTLQGEKLDVINSAGDDIRALSGRVPSLNIESSFGRAFPRFYIRGYGNTDFRLNASQPISLIYDDIVQENPILKGFPAFDLNRIEVLAGPQGTLLGRNTPGGVVKFDSVKPSQKQDAYFNATYGTYNTINLEGAVNLPLTGDWSVRLSGLTQNRDDYVTNTNGGPTPEFEGYRDRALRVQALYEPSKNFSALINVHNRDLSGSSRVFRGNIVQPGSNNLIGGFDRDRVAIDGQNFQELTSTGASLKLKINVGFADLYSITGYETVKTDSRGDVDGTAGPYGFPPFPIETSDGIRGHSQVTQEFRLESKDPGPFKWQAGFYSFSEKYTIDNRSFDSLGGGAQSEHIPTTQTNDSYALFGSVGYQFTDAFNLRGGLRFTNDKKSLSTTTVQAGFFPIDASNGLSRSTKDSQPSFDLSGTYKLNPDTNLYGRLATGYRGSSILPPSAFGALSSAPPETVTSYEAGVKADLFDKKARIAFGGFFYEVKDLQLSAVGGNSNATSLVSAQKATGQGLELSFDAYLTPNLLFSLSGSYNQTKIKDPSLSVTPCGGCTVTNPINAAGRAVIDGNPLPNAPKYIANFTLRYGIPHDNRGEYYIYTDWAYRSKVNFFLYESVEFTGKSLLEGGLRVGYTWADGKYEVAAFGRNITNTERITGAIDFTNVGFVNEPRTFGVQFKAAF